LRGFFFLSLFPFPLLFPMGGKSGSFSGVCWEIPREFSLKKTPLSPPRLFRAWGTDLAPHPPPPPFFFFFPLFRVPRGGRETDGAPLFFFPLFGGSAHCFSPPFLPFNGGPKEMKGVRKGFPVSFVGFGTFPLLIRIVLHSQSFPSLLPPLFFQGGGRAKKKPNRGPINGSVPFSFPSLAF